MMSEELHVPDSSGLFVPGLGTDGIQDAADGTLNDSVGMEFPMPGSPTTASGTAEAFPSSRTRILGPRPMLNEVADAHILEFGCPAQRRSISQGSSSTTHRRSRVLLRGTRAPEEHGWLSSSNSPLFPGNTGAFPDSSSRSGAADGACPSNGWPERPFSNSVDSKPPMDVSEDEDTFAKTSKAIRVRELYHWCATVAVLLLLQFVADCASHRFQHVPHPSEWCVVLLLLYSLASSVGLFCATRMRSYAGWLLAAGSFLMTCQLTWHWHSHVAQFKESLLVDPPTYLGMNRNSIASAYTSSSASSSPLYGFAFGSSGLDFLDAATGFVVLFLNCVQASFLCRLGVRIAAIVGVLQWTVFAFWPFIVADPQSTWACRIVAASIWTAHLIRSSYVWESELRQQSRCMDDLQHTVAETRRALDDRQNADSMLNHILKNTMADASGCIELFCQKYTPDDYLSKASDILFRGMWWCKLREAMLNMIAGRYNTAREMMNIQQFAQDFVRGREVALECPPQMLWLDPIVCNVVLDNAVTNARRHGCPNNPGVKLSVEITEPLRDEMVAAPTDDNTDGECAVPIEVRFVMRNRANPSRPLKAPWSSQQPSKPLPSDELRPTLSDGLGLQHISMVANSCGMEAQLWQQETEVFFQLRFNTTGIPKPAQPLLHVALPFPAGLHILVLDDSEIARTNLELKLQKEIPDATIAAYGKDVIEVEQFKRDAIDRGNILIVDENVDLPGGTLHGSSIVKQLVAVGYEGFACIRSGSSAEADKARSLRSGAHWHVGKDVWLRDMVSQLRAEYKKFKDHGKSKVQDTPLDSESFASCDF